MGRYPNSLFFKQGMEAKIGFVSIGIKPDLVIGDLVSVNPNLRTSLSTVYLHD